VLVDAAGIWISPAADVAVELDGRDILGSV